jgi:hypothetical protein
MVTPHRLYARPRLLCYGEQIRVETYFHIDSFTLAVLADGSLDGYLSEWKLFHGRLNQESR